jgi:predicted TIM-barrel fold metal-dependent hydrolase
MTISVAGRAPLCLPPRPLGISPALPAGAVDCHFHVFREGAPLATQRSYTPQIVTLADWVAFADGANVRRGVLIQPSVYGFDNSVLIEALAAAPDRLRGIVVLPPGTPTAELARLDRLGVRGVRINTRNKGGLPFDAMTALAKDVAGFGWTLQFQLDPMQLSLIADLAPALGVPVVVDHMGFIALDRSDADRSLVDLQHLLDVKHCYTKVSAPYRLTQAARYDAFGEAVATLVRSHPDRLLWGSDWPHTELWADVPDDAELIRHSIDWFGDETTRRRVFVTTPTSLFFERT